MTSPKPDPRLVLGRAVLDVHRRALEPGRDVIRTIRGKGYRFDADVRPADAGGDSYGTYGPGGSGLDTPDVLPAPDAALASAGRGRFRWPLVVAGGLLFGAFGNLGVTLRDPGVTAAPVRRDGEHEEHSRWTELLAVDPILAPLRSEPRFHGLVRALGLPGAG